MLVRMTTHITGYRDGVEWPEANGLLEVPDPEAADLINAGYAVAVDDSLLEAPGTGVPMEGIEVPADGTWSPTITGDGSGTALPPAPDPGDSTGITPLEASDGPAPQLDPTDGPDAPPPDASGPAAADGPDAPPAADSRPAGDVAPDLDTLDRAQLIALAAERGVEVSPRWGEKRLRAALA